jgi:hypothetical protein
MQSFGTVYFGTMCKRLSLKYVFDFMFPNVKPDK